MLSSYSSQCPFSFNTDDRPDIAFTAFRNGNRVLDDISKINQKTLEGAEGK